MNIFLGVAKLDNYILCIEDTAPKAGIEGEEVAFQPSQCTNEKYFKQEYVSCTNAVFERISSEMSENKFPIMNVDASISNPIDGQTYCYIQNGSLKIVA